MGGGGKSRDGPALTSLAQGRPAGQDGFSHLISTQKLEGAAWKEGADNLFCLAEHELTSRGCQTHWSLLEYAHPPTLPTPNYPHNATSVYLLSFQSLYSQGKTVPPPLVLLRMNAKLSRHVGGSWT